MRQIRFEHRSSVGVLSDRIQREEDCDLGTKDYRFHSKSFQTVSRGKRIATVTPVGVQQTIPALSDRIQREEDCDHIEINLLFSSFHFQTVSRGKRIATCDSDTNPQGYGFLSDRIQREEDCDTANEQGVQYAWITFRPYPEGRGLRRA